VKEILRRALSFLVKKEPFLVIEIGNQFVRISFLKVNFVKKKIEAVKILSEANTLSNAAATLNLVKRLLKRFRGAKRANIILSLDPVLATTVHSTVTLIRDKPKTPIDEPDLDNRIAQGIWRMFDRERGKAAEKMGVSDLDVLLTDVRVKNVKLDSHKVLNPLDFQAKTIEIQFTQTFNPRAFVGEVRKIIPAEKLVLMAENGSLEIDMLTKLARVESFLLVDLFDERVNIYLADGSTITYIDAVSWGKRNLLTTLSEFFAVTERLAEEIFRIYLVGAASPWMRKRIDRLLVDEFRKLTEPLAKLTAKYNSAVIYLLAFFEVPDFVFGPELKRELPGRARIMPVSHELLRAELGFELVSKASPTQNLFSPLAALLEFYFLPSNDKINRIARRHARWLIS